MKAERRHDLKTNALARGVEGVPDYWREYGSRILLVILVAAIVFLLVRYWNDKKAHDAKMVAEAVETANTSVHQLSQLPMDFGTLSATEMAEARQKIVQQAEQAINTVLNSSKDPKLLANAYLARGDLNWDLANFPELPGAETLPSQLQISNRDTYLEQARSSYEKVLQPPYSDSTTNMFYARMGLAAAAENMGQWDQARVQYEAIRDAANMPASFKAIADIRLAGLSKEQTPALLVPPPAVAPAAPSSMPASFGAATVPFGPIMSTSAPVNLPIESTRPSTTAASHPSTAP